MNNGLDKTFKRAGLLYGTQALETLAQKCVAVVGCGGVGSFVIESLARSGVGKLVLIDRDVVEVTNINRQLCALHSTIDQAKTEILKERIAQINPNCQVITHTGWYTSDLDEWLWEQRPDFVCDCIDSIACKKELISFCLAHSIPFICSMGMARKKDPTQIEVVELEKTIGDPMARNLRIWKRKNRIRKKIMTVSSRELPMDMVSGEPLPSAIFVPASAGLLMASWCVSQLIEQGAAA